MFNDYEIEILRSKLNEGQGSAKKRTVNFLEFKNIIKEIEEITTKIVKEYNYKDISFSYRDGYSYGGYSYTGTYIEGTVNDNGLINLDKLDIGRKSMSSSYYRISLNNINENIPDANTRKEFKKRYNVNNHGNINL